MQQTINYNLNKPETNDYINIDDLNSNMDAIDLELKKHSTSLAEMTNEASKTSSGWWKDKKTGLIIQWGTVTVDANNFNKYVTFPIAFPSAISIINLSGMSINTSNGIWSSSLVSTTGFTANIKVNQSTPTYETKAYWIAIGY